MNQEVEAPVQPPLAPPPGPPQAPPKLGDQVQFNFQPSETTESSSATPTANIFAQAFKNPPKLKHVTPPTVKNAAIDQPKNSVQAEKERIFEEQARDGVRNFKNRKI